MKNARRRYQSPRHPSGADQGNKVEVSVPKYVGAIVDDGLYLGTLGAAASGVVQRIAGDGYGTR